jgi:hypothetical protein
VEVQALGVKYGLKVLMPHKISVLAKWKERDRCCSGVGKVAPTQRSECEVCRLIDGVIKLNANDSHHPWLLRIDRNGHADLTLLHAMSRGHASTIDQNVSVVSEVEK